MKNLPLLYRTLKDIPAKQLLERLKYEIKIRTITKLPEKTAQSLLLGKLSTPELRKSYLEKLFISEQEVKQFEGKLSFEFLKESREFERIIWNSAAYPRLWQFHLHYFDYLTEDLPLVYNAELGKEAFAAKAQYLIKDWIKNNRFFSLDGWHPYTTSLRLVNWVYTFIAFPKIATSHILASTWKQLLYLSKNKESFAGGNHLLENLRAIIITGLYFDYQESEKIVKNAISQLETELNKQILADGGHYELSSSYHLLMTKLLAEVIIAIKSAAWDLPVIFMSKLEDMLEFSKAIRLQNGSYPLWNDAGFDSAPSIDEVISFASAVLGKELAENVDSRLPGIFSKLLETVDAKIIRAGKIENIGLAKLQSSGYYFLRSKEIEISFDAALPGPKELPGHAHADCLSFNLYKKGEPLIVETGTSQYGSGPIRSYERSTAAHNTVVINKQNQSEVWGGFRLGAKAKPVNLKSGQNPNLAWVLAGHDGYNKINAEHLRWIGLLGENTIIIDKISGLNDYGFASYLHLAPGQNAIVKENKVVLKPSDMHIDIFSNIENLNISLDEGNNIDSYYSPEMGLKIPRAKLNISAEGNRSNNIIVCMVFHFKEQISQVSIKNKYLSLQISDKSLKWLVNDREIHFIED